MKHIKNEGCNCMEENSSRQMGRFCRQWLLKIRICCHDLEYLSDSGTMYFSQAYNLYLCSGLEKSPFGAKSDFEIRAFKGFLYMYKKISPKKGLEVFTPKNLKWKKYIRQSENANGTPLEPLWGSK